jgi:peptide-methionine (S)-S-oxide reductase
MHTTKSILRTLATVAVVLSTTLGTDAQKRDQAMEQQVFYHTVKVDGLSIFYREAGPKDAPTILLLHGLPSSSRMFQPLLTRLADNYHLVAPDYPGYGHSDWPDPKTFDYTFDHIASVTPPYRNHGNHAEAIEIVFDPKELSYRKLLEFFLQIHDPTTLNRQGNDRGTRYRSAIFYTSDEQKRKAEETIADADASGICPGKAVTEVESAGPFWEAEPKDQDYLERYPNGYTCHYIRPNWRLPHRAA